MNAMMMIPRSSVFAIADSAMKLSAISRLMISATADIDAGFRRWRMTRTPNCWEVTRRAWSSRQTFHRIGDSPEETPPAEGPPSWAWREGCPAAAFEQTRAAHYARAGAGIAAEAGNTAAPQPPQHPDRVTRRNVTFRKDKGRWWARIRDGERWRHAGYFATREEAEGASP